MRAQRLGMWMIVAALAAYGCDGGDPPPTDSGPGTDSGPMTGTDAGPGTDSGPVTTGDGNDTFATATALGTEAAMGVINPAGDLDYYSFTGTAGQWVILATEANAEDDPMMVDTVITLYDASMNQIAENDDGVPRVNTDSELITRLPADGTYYVLVQEFSTWDGATGSPTPEGNSTFTYSLTVAGLNASSEAVTVDSEPGNLAADAQTAGFNVGTNIDFGIIAGVLDGEADGVDVFAISPATARALVQGQIMPVGTDGNGSTLTPTSLSITNADGTVTIAKIDPVAFNTAEADMEIGPNLPAGEYRLWVERSGAAGANDFYVLKVFRYGDNPAEPTGEETANNDIGGASAITLMDDEGVQRGFVLADLATGDTDFFSFNVADASHRVTAVCSSRSSGSGVQDLQVQLVEVATPGTVIAMDTETATESAFIEQATVSNTGSHAIRISRGAQITDVTGEWVRCGVAIGPMVAAP